MLSIFALLVKRLNPVHLNKKINKLKKTTEL